MTRIGPADLMAAPGRVLEELIAVVAEQGREAAGAATKARHAERMARLRGAAA